jgi:hypothetical protein
MASRTPSQTIGPFFHEALRWSEGARLAPAASSPRVVLAGRILDGGNPWGRDGRAWRAPRGFGAWRPPPTAPSVSTCRARG